MPEIVNLTKNLVDQKISEIAQKSSHPYHSALFNLNLRKKLVVCILNQLQPKYMFFETDHVSLAEVENNFSEYEQKRIERLINNSIVPTLQEANAIEYFPCQLYEKPQK